MDIKIEKIIRSKRRTIALQLTENAALIVRAPFNVSEHVINKFISRHENLIEKKRKEILLWNSKIIKKEFINSERFLYLGDYYNLTIVENQKFAIRFEKGFYLSKKYLPYAKEVFILWYKYKALEKITERVELYAKEKGFKYNKIGITNAQKRWGSCSTTGNLNFTYRLIMAPVKVIDSVVVHELVHLVEQNHSQSFWRKVHAIMPDNKKYKNWLKENGYTLKV